MKHFFPRKRYGCARCLNPLSLGLFLTACLLFAFSFVFYFLSLLPI